MPSAESEARGERAGSAGFGIDVDVVKEGGEGGASNVSDAKGSAGTALGG